MPSLVTFAVDPKSLGELDKPGLDRLLDTWRSHCVLVDEGIHHAESELNCAVAELSQEKRKTWQKFQGSRLARISKKMDCESIDWPLFHDVPSLESLPPVIELYALEEFASLLIEETTKILSSEYVITKEIDRSVSIDRAKSLSGQDIPKNTNLRKIWTEHFQLFARTSSQIDVVDQYCLGRHVQRSDTSGLRFFLEALARDGRDATVDVYAGAPVVPSESNQSSLIDLVSRLDTHIAQWGRTLSGAGIKKLRIHLITNTSGIYQQQFHQRWFRFDMSRISCGRGVGLFDRDWNSAGVGASYYTDNISYSNPPDIREQSLQLRDNHLYRTIDVF